MGGSKVSAPAAPLTFPESLGISDLWKHIFGDTPGLLAVWTGLRVAGAQELADPKTSWYEWPQRSLDASAQLDDESDHGREAYFCAHLLTKRRRVKPNAAKMLALYVDGDGATVPAHLPQPTARVQSSPGREQDYWRLTRAIDPAKGEQLNKRLAYAMGADKSGWDLTQLLRPPRTRNHKYEGHPRVEIISIEDRAYDPDELERILPPLPAETTARVEVKLERSATAGPIGDRDQRALERMRSGKRGSEIQMLENGGSKFSKQDGSPDGNRNDLSVLSAYAFWLDKDPPRMARAFEQTARVRPKLHEVHYASGETYLEHSIAEAIAGCSQSFRDLNGYDAGDDPPRIHFTASGDLAAEPSPETSPSSEPTTLDEWRAEALRLRRALLDHDDQADQDRERLSSIIEVQQTVLAATRAELEQERGLRARDRRVTLAAQRLDRVSQFSAGQKAAIKAVAQIAPPLANTHQVDDPIITREMVAAVYGAKPDTAGDHLTVFDIEGSPVTRTDKPYGTKTLKHFELKTRDPAEIIEWMAALGEQLEKRPTATKTPRCKACPEGTGTIVNIICEGCGGLLDERHVKAPKIKPVDNVEKNATLENPPPSAVNGLVTYGGEKPYVAETPEAADTRATAMVGTPLDRDVDQWKRVESRSREPVSIGPIRMTDRRASVVDVDPNAPHTIAADVEPPDWLDEWPDPDAARSAPPAPASRCIRPGCADPCGPGDRLLCIGHRAEANAPVAVAGGEPFVPSAEWQLLPDGYVCPPGVEWQANLSGGPAYVRWPAMEEPAAGVAGGEE